MKTLHDTIQQCSSAIRSPQKRKSVSAAGLYALWARFQSTETWLMSRSSSSYPTTAPLLHIHQTTRPSTYQTTPFLHRSNLTLQSTLLTPRYPSTMSSSSTIPVLFTIPPSNRHEVILIDTSSKPTLKALNAQITSTIADSPNCAEFMGKYKNKEDLEVRTTRKR